MEQQNPELAAAQRLADTETDFQCLHEFVARARQALSQNEWDYIAGGAETETTLKRNRLAIDQLAFRPRVLRDVNAIDTTAEAFGTRLRLPVLFAPVGALESFHDAAAAAVVRAAGEFGIAHMLSSVCMPGLEKVAEIAPKATRLFQLYVRGDEAWVDDYVARAIDKGYRALCFTVDTAIYSRRERDIAKRHVVAGRRRASGREFQAALDWRTIARVKERFAIPLVLKGIATAEDAKIAVEHGVDWIYVSNHGGRQLDHGRGALDIVPEVVEAVKGRARIIVDGGFARGADIVKAVAAGADLVGLGRMQCYALAAGGEDALVQMLEILEDEVTRTLGLLGVTKLSELDRSYLHRADAVVSPHALSAFPLLRIEEYRY
jgi:isopentenyl diphosphate isomerase/L-lactate dehydrogenase-like FMN-dependent dehydrogenase